MKTKDSFDGTTRSMYGEVVTRDCYMMKQWGSDFFDNIVDIGANVGCFVTYAHMRHPRANLFAYEPCKETFQRLRDNCGHMGHVEFIDRALGDGSLLYLYDIGWAGCNQFFKQGEKGVDTSYGVESISLSDIVRTHQISLDSKYYIKIDSEGGERFLLDDAESVGIIRRACGFAVEVHFPPHGNRPNQENVKRFGGFPEWKIYNSWIHDNFDKTHDIIYHMSSKSRGAGLYVLSLT